MSGYANGHATSEGSDASCILLLVCPDQKGIVNRLASFVSGNNGNIIDNDFHNDRTAGLFLGRLEWSLKDFAITDRSQIRNAAMAVCSPLGGTAFCFFSDEVMNIAIFCSKQDHCLLDLLWRWKSGELGVCNVKLIVSNHEDLRKHADLYGVPYHVFKITKDNKREQEAAEIELLRQEGIDLVIMAKYMQILSDDFCTQMAGRVINIHHSFLPAFIGAKPYHQAYARGVKLIGATAHFATAELDAGPIVDQEVVRVSHRDTVEDLVRKGMECERQALARAVRWHVAHRVLTYGNKTCVFGS